MNFFLTLTNFRYKGNKNSVNPEILDLRLFPQNSRRIDGEHSESLAKMSP